MNIEDILQGLNEIKVLNSSVIQNILCQLENIDENIKKKICNEYLELIEKNEECECVIENLFDIISNHDEKSNLSTIHKQIIDYKKIQEEINEHENKLRYVKISDDIKNDIINFKSLISQGKYCDSGWILVSLKNKIEKNNEYIKKIQKDNINYGEVEECEIELHNLLNSQFNEYISYKDDVNSELIVKLFHSHKREDNPVSLLEIWKCSEIINKLSEFLQYISNKILNGHLKAILDSNCEIERIDSELESKLIVVEYKNKLYENIIEKIELKFKNIILILDYISNILFCEIGWLLLKFYEDAWPIIIQKLYKTIYDAFEEMQGNSKLEFLHGIIKLSKIFENDLKTKGFLLSEEKEHILSYKLIEISKNGLRKNNERYFINTREIIKNPEWDETITVGQDLIIDKKEISKIKNNLNLNLKEDKSCKLDIERSSVLNQGKYRITNNAIKIINIIKEVLFQEVNTIIELMRESSTGAVSDILLLYRNLFPVINQNEMQAPQISFLYANDCLYISEMILILGFSINYNFINESIKLKETFKETIQKEVYKQVVNLVEISSSVQNFSSIKSGQDGIAMRHASIQIHEILSRLGKILKEVLRPNDRVDVASFITEQLLSPILSSLMSLSNISQQLSEELPRILHPLINEIPSAILNINNNILKNRVVNDEFEWIIVNEYYARCPKLVKLERLIEIFKAKLVEITDWWKEGVLRNDGFLKDEIKNLIWALFEHSNLREKCIAQII